MAPHTINRLIKAAARRAGIQDRAIAGHSLRSGFLTAAALRGASMWKQVSRHRSVAALQGYVRDRDGFRDHAGLGLLYARGARAVKIVLIVIALAAAFGSDSRRTSSLRQGEEPYADLRVSLQFLRQDLYAANLRVRA
jgi:site-specific recombinase XerD